MKKTFSLLLFIYFLAIIIFRQNYNSITWVVDIVLFIFYALANLKESYHFKYNYIIGIFFLFTVLTMLSAFYGINFDSSMYRVMPLILLFLNLFIIYNIVLYYKLVDVILKSFLMGAFLNYLIMLKIIHAPFSIYFGDNITNFRAIGTLGNPNIFATFMLISILISFIYIFKKEKISLKFYYFQYFNIILALYMVVLSVSKQGMIMSVLLIMGYLLIIPKDAKQWKVIIILFLIIYIGISNYIDLTATTDLIVHRFEFFENALNSTSDQFGSTGVRKALIAFGLDAFQENPIFGIGIGNFHIISTVLSGPASGVWAENNYVELLVDVFVLFYVCLHIL